MNKRSFIFACVALVAVTQLAYLGVSDGDFVLFDDPLYVTENEMVKKGMTVEGVVWAFAHQSPYTLWHPVTWISHMLDCTVFGLNPAGHHLTSLAIHTANVLLFFLILRRMTQAHWRSFLVAAIFAVHPINVDSVVWIAERKSVLVGFFWLLTMVAYQEYANDPAPRRYLLVFLCFFVGLLTKQTMVTLPCALLLLDVWPLQRLPLPRARSKRVRQFISARDTLALQPQMREGNSEMWRASVSRAGLFDRRLPNDALGRRPLEARDYLRAHWRLMLRLGLEKLPFLVLSLGVSRLTLEIGPQHYFFINLEERPLSLRTANAMVSIFRYIGKCAWPADLSIFYPFPGHVPAATAILAAGIIILISGIVISRLPAAPYLAVGWLWFIGTLTPVLGLIQHGLWPAMADRWAYIPFMGLYVVAVWGTADLLKYIRVHRWVGPASSAVLLTLLTTATTGQVRHWRDSKSLMSHCVTMADGNFVAQNFLGLVYERENKIEDALYHYSASVRGNANYPFPQVNLAAYWYRRGEFREAGRRYHIALELMPFNRDFSLSAPLRLRLADSYRRQGDFQHALQRYRQAYDPHDADLNVNIGGVCHQLGHWTAAARFYLRAIRIDPRHAQAHFNLGLAYERLGRSEEAANCFDNAFILQPDIMGKLGGFRQLDRQDPERLK